MSGRKGYVVIACGVWNIGLFGRHVLRSIGMAVMIHAVFELGWVLSDLGLLWYAFGDIEMFEQWLGTF